MNILIIYPFYNQRSLMHNFSEKLKEYGVFADILCVDNYDYEKTSSVQWPNTLEKCFLFLKGLKPGFLKRAFVKVFNLFVTEYLFHNYDLIDFHAYYPRYNHLMRFCVCNRIKFDITLWGSDLMRADDNRKELMKYGFDNCYRIKLSENLYDLLKTYYGGVYNEKSRIVYFGNSDLPIIESLTLSDVEQIKRRLYGNVSSKIIVVLGYNGLMAQNHFEMISALDNLNSSEKETIHVVIPMTYGATANYIDDIKKRMKKASVSFSILDHFLDTKEIAAVRKSADIVINIQDTDALAGSLQDHLFCGNVCIFGDWLNYSPYVNNGIYYIKTSKDDIGTHLKDVLHNYNSYRLLCNNNSSKINVLFSWESTIKKQVDVYDESGC